MFETIWNHWADFQKTRARSLKAELVKLERKIEQLLDRIVDADSSTVISAYEKRIAKLEKDKIAMAENIASCGKPVRGFDESFRTALAFLSNPWKLWASEALEDKRAVLKLAFADRLAYVRNEGFRTAQTTLPFKVLGGISGGEIKMAEREGFEHSIFLIFSIAYETIMSRTCLLLSKIE